MKEIQLKKTNIFLFKIFLFLELLNQCLFEKCSNREKPFFLNNECVESCEEEDIESDLCTLDNEIIKTQYLNNIIYINELNIVYIEIDVSENNNLYYILSTYPQSNTRVFYIINNEGYGLFEKDNPISKIEVNDPRNLGRYESVFFAFQLLSDSDNKEYLINIPKSNQLTEVYDLYSNNIYSKNAENFLDVVNIFSYVGVHLKLKKNKNTYIIGLSASEFQNSNQYHYFFIKKGYFTSLDIENNSPIFETQKAETTDAKIVSCYETTNNYIVCFYQNKAYKYSMIVYDFDLNEKDSVEIAEGISSLGYDYIFFKCIHFFEETGVFGYFNNEENRKIFFQFKEFSNNEIKNHYQTISKLPIENIFFNYNIKSCDMIKIEDKKFYYVGFSISGDILYVITIYNYYNENFVLLIYSINVKSLNNYIFSNVLKINIYKNFLVLASKNEVNLLASLIIFSYPNTSEKDFYLFDYLYNNNNIKINNLSFKIEGESIIENNIFGYVYSGIQIIENCNDSKIYLVNSKNEKVVNYFLPKNEEIKLLIPYNDLYSPFICTIKYTTVVSEPDFSEFKKYPININYIGGNENDNNLFFHKNYYIGKVNNFNLILNETLTTINCMDNCELCDNNNIGNCVTCKYSSNINNNTKICENIIDNTQNNEYIKECSSKDFLNNLCQFKNTNKDLIIKNIEIDIQNRLLDPLISNVIEREKTDLLIKSNDTIYQLTSTENQKNNKNNNISTIILGECENILKREYHINETLPLIILKIDYYKEDSLIPIIGYEVFHPENKSKLDLNYCKNEFVNFSIPVEIDEDNSFKYDPESEYYTDQCNPYTTENGTDILLNDRQYEYNDNNMAICENNCTFNSYNSDTKQVICECQIKQKQIIISEIINQTDLLYYNFTNIDESSSMNSIKCYYTLFTKEGIITNIANYILLFTIILFLISSILFYKCGYHLLEMVIQNKLSLRSDKIKKINNKKSNENNLKEKVYKAKENLNPNKKNDKNKYKNKKNNRNRIKDISQISKSSSKLDPIIYSKKRKNNKISLNDKNKKDEKLIFNDYELNSMNYENALKFDKRSYFNIYISLIKTKHPVLFSFYPIKDYNTIIVKIDLFFLSFSIYYFMNFLFFNDKVIHKIYKDEGIYNFKYFIPFILLSFIISHCIFIFIKYFSLSESNICELNNFSISKSGDLIHKIKRCITIKYILFYILSLIFLFLFWYILSSFSSVFQNTQIYLIKNTMISFCFSLIYPFIINLMPAFLRVYSLKDSKRELVYKINRYIQFI